MKRLVRAWALAVASVVLGACAAVGVPASGDPWVKYQQACALLESGRVFPAHALLTDALASYERSGDPIRLAAVQAAYATVIESPTFVVHPLFHKDRMALGGREALPARARQLREQARDALRSALDVPAAKATAAEREQARILLADLERSLGEAR